VIALEDLLLVKSRLKPPSIKGLERKENEVFCIRLLKGGKTKMDEAVPWSNGEGHRYLIEQCRIIGPGLLVGILMVFVPGIGRSQDRLKKEQSVQTSKI